jgi:hypothetical protein
VLLLLPLENVLLTAKKKVIRRPTGGLARSLRWCLRMTFFLGASPETPTFVCPSLLGQTPRGSLRSERAGDKSIWPNLRSGRTSPILTVGVRGREGGKGVSPGNK